jgi:2-polyprenyl-3-methyl-5-hydroxy-6-metoxy-1,4-benzoquinol methylase
MEGLENIYSIHHKNRRGGFAILQEERGEFLRKYIGEGKTVLDIGCRDGQLTSNYSLNNYVTGVDIDSEALNLAKERLGISVIHFDLNKDWNFTDKKFDVVVACEFLEHIYFPDLVINKAKLLIKQNGLFIGSIPHAYSLQSRVKFLLGIKKGTPLEDPTHINHFKYAGFKKLLEENFSDVKVVGWVPKRYRLLSKIFPFLFAHDLMFVGVKK